MAADSRAIPGPEEPAVAVVGGGAAGLMAALFAAREGARVVLLEGSQACGVKILVSGGGRCNVLPSEWSLDDFHTSGSRHVLRRLFATWPLEEIHRFFEADLEIPLVTEEGTGKVFPSAQRARVIRDGLREACLRAGALVRESWRVSEIRVREPGGFALTNTAGESLPAAAVILAAGGLSLPKTGSDGAGYGLAAALGHTLVPTYPALVPLTTADTGLQELSGVSLPVRWRVRQGGRVREDRVRELLFTHRGFSGPAVLDASHWVTRDGAMVEVGWLDRNEDWWRELFRESPRRQIAHSMAAALPRRLARYLFATAGLPAGLCPAHLGREQRERLLRSLCAFPLPVSGNEGYAVAEVTGGGLPLAEVQPSTLESRRTPGLFLCGEILDVIGRIGGYNFLWAWVTGRLAGQSAARMEGITGSPVRPPRE